MTAPHIQRMIDEKTQLSDRVEKLGAFFDGPIFRQLPSDDGALLIAQHGAMKAYLGILNIRLDRALAEQ